MGTTYLTRAMRGKTKKRALKPINTCSVQKLPAWSLHNLMGIYIGDLIPGIIYFSAWFMLLLAGGKELINRMLSAY